jgi:hypothetical protein
MTDDRLEANLVQAVKMVIQEKPLDASLRVSQILKAQSSPEERPPTGVHSGACFCGKVTWEVDFSKHMMGVICHCKDDRAYFSSPFFCGQLFGGGSFKYTAGEDFVGKFQQTVGKGNVRLSPPS